MTHSALPEPVRLAILDDHEALLDSLTAWIEANAPDFALSLVASTWLHLVHSDRFPTDLVLLDFQLKEPVSIEARVRTCRAAGAKVIVLSSLDSPDVRERALAAGAAAFVSTTRPMREVMDVARRVMGMTSGSVPVREWRPLPSGALGDPGSPSSTPASALAVSTRPPLSAGECEALTLYVSGLSMAQVAVRMDVRYETVKTYLRRVREKYARASRPASKKAELIRRAAEDGYLH
jgi:DNA-binding NarL/FixJ family response regulator